MWVEQQKNGKFKFVERFVNPMTGKDQRVSVTLDKDTKSSRKQAAILLNEKMDRNMRELSMSSKKSKITLSELVAAYRESQKLTVKDSTYRRNYYATESFKRILGENTLVSRLTSGYVKAKFLETGDSSGTLNERLTRFKAMIRWGYENDIISDISFLSKLKPFKDISKREKIQDKFLESEELELLLNNMANPFWVLFTKLLALSGMRIGEAIALDVSDVDFAENVIHVSKTYDYVSDQITPPKTSTSIRDIYMQSELRDVCKEIYTYMLRQSLMFGYKRNGLFMQNEKGQCIQYYSYNKYLKENAKRILNRDKVTPHIMRHTHTCLLAENGIDLDTISRRLGHEDSKTTKSVYYHVTKKMKERDNQQIAKVKIF